MIKTWIIATVAVLAVLCLGTMLDASALSARAMRPSDATAYRLCASIGGPNAWFVYNDAGKLICVNKRSNKLKTQP